MDQLLECNVIVFGGITEMATDTAKLQYECVFRLIGFDYFESIGLY